MGQDRIHRAMGWRRRAAEQAWRERGGGVTDRSLSMHVVRHRPVVASVVLLLLASPMLAAVETTAATAPTAPSGVTVTPWAARRCSSRGPARSMRAARISETTISNVAGIS